jgi:hypothetical protein
MREERDVPTAGSLSIDGLPEEWLVTSDDLPTIGAPATRALASIGVTGLDQTPGESDVSVIASVAARS